MPPGLASGRSRYLISRWGIVVVRRSSQRLAGTMEDRRQIASQLQSRNSWQTLAGQILSVLIPASIWAVPLHLPLVTQHSLAARLDADIAALRVAGLLMG